MWPASVQRLQKNKKNNDYTCSIRYFEVEGKSKLFTVDANKCEVFFRPDTVTHSVTKVKNIIFKVFFENQVRYWKIILYIVSFLWFIYLFIYKEINASYKPYDQFQTCYINALKELATNLDTSEKVIKTQKTKKLEK